MSQEAHFDEIAEHAGSLPTTALPAVSTQRSALALIRCPYSLTRVTPEGRTAGRPLPKSDFLVVTWTIAEWRALAKVLAPEVPLTQWTTYARHYESYTDAIAADAPAKQYGRLGSWIQLRSDQGWTVLCFKSDLHMNQDGISLAPGRATLPLLRLWGQIIQEVAPQAVISTGTAGAVESAANMGDVIVTRGSSFLLDMEFRNSDFNGQTYRSPLMELPALQADLQLVEPFLIEPDFRGPTTFYQFPGGRVRGRRNKPRVLMDGRDFRPYLPMCTTDRFRFGITGDKLARRVSGLEMGDAVLGLYCKTHLDDKLPWLVVRNVSTPRIDSRVSQRPDVQGMWAFFYYTSFGFYTSLCSSLVVAAALRCIEEVLR